MCGIDESSRRRGFADFALKVFHIDFIEGGCSRNTETALKPVNLNSLIDVERVPRESDKPPNSNEDASLPSESTNNERVDSFSASDSDSDSDSEEEVDNEMKMKR